MLQRAVLGETEDGSCQMAVSSSALGHSYLPDTGSDYRGVAGDRADCSLADQTASSHGQHLESTASETVYSYAEVVSLTNSKDQPIPVALSDSITDLGGSLSDDEV